MLSKDVVLVATQDRNKVSSSKSGSKEPRVFTNLERAALYIAIINVIAVSGALLVQLGESFRPTILQVQQTSSWLLTLNGVLFGLVATFSTVYMTLIEGRRLDAAQTTTNYTQELKSSLTPLYRSRLRSFAWFIVVVGLSFALLLALTYSTYLLSFGSQTFPIWATYLYSLSAASPMITIGDFLVILGYISFDIAGRGKERQLQIMNAQRSESSGEPNNKIAPTLNYFAYGSNMDSKQMKERGAAFTKRTRAVLEDYVLKFNKVASGRKAKRGEGKGNIVFEPRGIVEGALYDITEDGLHKLDAKEGYPNEYYRIKLPLKLDDGSEEEAWTYFAQPDKVADGLRPTRNYLEHYLKGKDLLSSTYYTMLQRVKTLEDA